MDRISHSRYSLGHISKGNAGFPFSRYRAVRGVTFSQFSGDFDSVAYRVCGELLFRPQPVVGRGLCSDFANDRNVDPQLLPVSLWFFRLVDRRPMHNGSDGHCRNP